MELKAELKTPYTEREKADFIVEQNHNLGYEIRYLEEIEAEGEKAITLQAWGNTEEEFEEKRRKNFENNFFEISPSIWFRKTPKGYSSAVEAINTAFNITATLGKLPEGVLTFYTAPNFQDPLQCTEEWLLEHKSVNSEMTSEKFGIFYAEFITAWNAKEHKENL